MFCKLANKYKKKNENENKQKGTEDRKQEVKSTINWICSFHEWKKNAVHKSFLNISFLDEVYDIIQNHVMPSTHI